jgi:hypothetical protein
MLKHVVCRPEKTTEHRSVNFITSMATDNIYIHIAIIESKFGSLSSYVSLSLSPECPA